MTYIVIYISDLERVMVTTFMYVIHSDDLEES